MLLIGSEGVKAWEGEDLRRRMAVREVVKMR